MANETIGDLADHEQPARTVPRLALRIVWLLHRAMVRLSGRRFGLQRPDAGKRFGMMRLTTVGRRSGTNRLAIVGYYEDGASLVTLAMNGWGRTEPAWWLNLQANSEARVELPDGAREVRARAATAEEREGLWSRLADYPGWGDDLDALASRRPDETAIVVLEPRLLAATTDRADAQDQAPAAPGKRDQRSAAAATARTSRLRRLRPRHLWLLPGIGLALFANGQASQLSVGLVPLLVFSIVPDLPRFIGTRRPTMLALHNATHNPVLALVVLLGTVVIGISPFLFVGALAWLGHIVVGWGAGDRIKSAGEPGTAVSRGLRPGRIVLATESAEA